MWEPNDRYPDPAVQALDASFAKYRLPLASVERLATGCRWSEGPVYFGDGRYVLWSDIPLSIYALCCLASNHIPIIKHKHTASASSTTLGTECRGGCRAAIPAKPPHRRLLSGSSCCPTWGLGVINRCRSGRRLWNKLLLLGQVCG